MAGIVVNILIRKKIGYCTIIFYFASEYIIYKKLYVSD